MEASRSRIVWPVVAVVVAVVVIGFASWYGPGRREPNKGPSTGPGVRDYDLVVNGTAGGNIIEGEPWLPVMGLNNTFNLTVRITSVGSPVSWAHLYLQQVGVPNFTYTEIPLAVIVGDSYNGLFEGDVPHQSAPGFIYYYFSASNGYFTKSSPESGRFWMEIVPGGTP